MKRVISTQLQEEDIKIEKSLRPMYFDDYIGQQKIKDNLKIYIEAAKSKINNSIIKEKINQINLAYEQGILTEEERVLKLANLDQKRRTT